MSQWWAVPMLLSSGLCANGGSRVLGALPLEDQLVVLGGAERGHTWGEDLHQSPAVPRLLMHDLLVGVPRFVAGAEPRRTPIVSEPHKLVLPGRIHPVPFPSLTRLMIEHHRCDQ